MRIKSSYSILAVLLFFSGVPGFSAEDVNLQEISTLEHMNALMQGGACKDPKNEECQSLLDWKGERYAGQVRIVAKLHDPRAIPALIGALDARSTASIGLIELGDPAVEALLKEVDQADKLKLRSILLTFQTILDLRVLSHFSRPDEIRSEFKTIFLKYRDDPDLFVRSAAREGLQVLDTGVSKTADQVRWPDACSSEPASCIMDPDAFVTTQEQTPAHQTTQMAMDAGPDGPLLLVAANSLLEKSGGPYHAFLRKGECYSEVGVFMSSSGAIRPDPRSEHCGLSDVSTFILLSAKKGTFRLYRFDGKRYQVISQKEMTAKTYFKVSEDE